MSQEFYNFDEALDQLNLKEEELKRLVSEGEIRAFREGDTMKLRRQDVEHLRSELVGGELVDLGEAGEDLVFEDELLLEDAGMATEEISEMDTLLEEDVEDVGEFALGGGFEADPPRRATGAPERAPVRRAAALGADEDDGEGAGMRALLILNTVLLVLAAPIVVSIATGSTSDIAKSVAGIFAEFPN